MLRRFSARGFKSLDDVTIEVPRLLVLFGPNAAGKSNFLEALQCLSRLVTERTVKDALTEPIRGYPVEAFRMPPGGLRDLMNLQRVSFCLGADVLPKSEPRALRYRVEISGDPRTGSFGVADEYLAGLQSKKDKTLGKPVIERQGDRFVVRVRGKPAHPKYESIGTNHTTASVPSYTGSNYPHIDQLRRELGAWRTYYLDPRVAMREARPPSEVNDVGPLGETVAPYLYRLKVEHPKCFEGVRRTLRTLIPSVEGVDVGLDRDRGHLEIVVQQNGVQYSTRVISEGTLRVLALCSLCVNPWRPALVAFEEPENGVHPRRLDLIAEMLVSLATEGATQVVVTTHSPRFCDAVWKRREPGGEVALYAVRRERARTVLEPFDPAGPLFKDVDVMRALTSPAEDGVFESLIQRGLVDE
ncbi:MAG TPA: AAA family ATPase [Planctomycetota bacterium]|nr:AAA family ATPase [Planctomycetota bacterium]HRR79289.1 AAA family ATPase [Planctomycetota bacterium]HRT96872.1 AAA family ATPase [Planctomycetota bacterium]